MPTPPAGDDVPHRAWTPRDDIRMVASHAWFCLGTLRTLVVPVKIPISDTRRQIPFPCPRLLAPAFKSLALLLEPIGERPGPFAPDNIRHALLWFRDVSRAPVSACGIAAPSTAEWALLMAHEALSLMERATKYPMRRCRFSKGGKLRPGVMETMEAAFPGVHAELVRLGLPGRDLELDKAEVSWELGRALLLYDQQAAEDKAEDLSAFRPLSDFLDPCRFKTPKRIHKALKLNPWIRHHKPCRNRHLIHAGDWLKYKAFADKSRFLSDIPILADDAPLPTEVFLAEVLDRQPARRRQAKG